MNREGGYTIVELLIVLAISAIMLSGAITMIGGQQNKTQFVEAIRDFQSQIQLTLAEVSTNTYPNSNRITCTANASGVVLSSGGADDNTGRNVACVVIGKAVHFYRDADSTSGIKVYTLVGKRFVGGGDNGIPAITYSQAKPTIVDPLFTAGATTLTDEHVLKSGIRIDKIIALDNTPLSPILGILTSLNGIGGVSLGSTAGGYNATKGSFNSGTQNMFLSPLGSSTTIVDKTQSQSQASAFINDLQGLNASQPNLVPYDGYIVCLSNNGVVGTKRQFATLTVSGSGAASRVSNEINGGICT